MKLPFPTGKSLEDTSELRLRMMELGLKQNKSQEEFEEYNKILREFLSKNAMKYNDAKDLKTKNEWANKVTREYERLLNKYANLFTDGLNLIQNPDLTLLKEFIEEINDIGLYELPDVLNQRLVIRYQIMFKGNIGQQLAKIVNEHNMYLGNVSKSRLTSIAKNYSMYKMYKVIDTPVNLIQALSSVDAMTTPLKDIGNAQPVSSLINVRTPGNCFDKAESIEDNQVGKEGIGICAVGMKSFFGLTAYANTIANYGDDLAQQRLKLGPNGRGIPITKVGDTKPTWYLYLANINPKISSKLYETLSKYNSDTDAALILSALLSLATD